VRYANEIYRKFSQPGRKLFSQNTEHCVLGRYMSWLRSNVVRTLARLSSNSRISVKWLKFWLRHWHCVLRGWSNDWNFLPPDLLHNTVGPIWLHDPGHDLVTCGLAAYRETRRT